MKAGKRTVITYSLLIPAMVALVLGAGCARKHESPKVVFLGIDGMEWRVAEPLIEQGRLPNIAAIVERGVKVDLRSIGPEMKSPIIWTTIATGKTPRKHGIGDFVSDEKQLFNSLGWKARAVWDILGEYGHTVGVINWWLSWPAQPVSGYMVTDRIAYTAGDGYPEIPELTAPPELAEELASHTRPVSRTPDSEIAPFLNGDTWDAPDDCMVGEGVKSFRGIYAADQTVLGVSKHLIESREQPDFLAIYFQGLDVTCHRFWGEWDPTSVDLQMSDELIETFSDLIPRYYERIDAAIGEILEVVDENSTVIICSDHGFRGPFRSPEGLKLGIWMHREIGVLAAAGPGIARLSKRMTGSVFDITPTLLALYDIPVGRDMDGFVLSEILEEGFMASRPVSYVPTHENGRRVRSDQPEASAVDEAIKEKLRSLGYIE
jgi:predicted AlkP superfamily phosphohydrolase/phosphomutase